MDHDEALGRATGKVGSMDKNRYLVALAESSQTEFGRVDFAEQSSDQQVFSAVWALEAEVNNGGLAHYFASWGGDTANFALPALERIGARNAAAIVSQALAIVSSEPLPDDQAAREALVERLPDDQVAVLEELDAQFLAYPDDLTEHLFAFVAARPQTFGATPPS